MGGVIVWKKTIFLIIVLILSVITLGGCKMKGFNNQKEAEEFILQNLEDKYGENFDITKVKKYKEEKIGINWIQAEAKAENQDDIFQVCQEKKYIKKYEIDISGNLSETKWTGKEDIDEYIKKEEYTIEPMIYLENNQTDEQYAEIISDWLMTLSKLECSMRVLVKIEDLNIVIFDEEFESGEKNMNEYTEELLKEEINNTRKNSNTIKEYKKWKQENKK